MTIRESINMINTAIPKDADAVALLLVGVERNFLTEGELERLDVLRGDKLNLVHKEFWKPEEITKEDADLIRRGLDVYRKVLWELRKDEIMEGIAKGIAEKGLQGDDDANIADKEKMV